MLALSGLSSVPHVESADYIYQRLDRGCSAVAREDSFQRTLGQSFKLVVGTVNQKSRGLGTGACGQILNVFLSV